LLHPFIFFRLFTGVHFFRLECNTATCVIVYYTTVQFKTNWTELYYTTPGEGGPYIELIAISHATGPTPCRKTRWTRAGRTASNIKISWWYSGYGACLAPDCHGLNPHSSLFSRLESWEGQREKINQLIIFTYK
jgi:hypothetical protein